MISKRHQKLLTTRVKGMETIDLMHQYARDRAFITSCCFKRRGDPDLEEAVALQPIIEAELKLRTQATKAKQ